ncbi:MAG: hypothetical protein K2L42_06975 [Clostridia bacterium]|nr:hypothetical protein [Clostridia bacterium]
MGKFKSSVLIIGIFVIIIAASLLTVLLLYLTGGIAADPIQLVYKVENAEKTYDGTPLSAKSYTLVSGELLKGHSAVAQFEGEQTEAGAGLCGLSVKIYDKNNFEVTDKYSVKTEKGILTVFPEEITVVLNDKEVVYNGGKILFDDYSVTEGKLVAGHKIAGSASAELVNAGDKLPADLKPLVYDAAGKDVTANYSVRFIAGEISVIPRPITVKPLDMKKVYDGTALVCTSYELKSGSLAEGHSAAAEIDYGEAALTEADKIITEITDFIIKDLNGKDVTDNYDITCLSGALEVTPLNLTVYCKTLHKEYDGAPLSDLFYNSNIYDISPALPQGFTLSGNSGGVEDLTDACSGSYTLSDIVVSDADGIERTGNFNISVIGASYNVSKKSVSVKLADVSREYDGEAYEIDVQAAFRGAELPEPLKETDFEIVPHSEMKNAGRYTYSARLLNADAAKNYQLDIASGRAEITKKNVALSYNGGDIIKVYDGTPAEIDCAYLSVDFNGFRVASAEYEKAVNVLNNEDIRQIAVFGAVIKDANGADVTSNFNVDYGAALINVKITRRQLILSLDDYTHTGEDYPNYIEDEVLFGLVGITGGTSLAKGDSIRFTVDYYNKTIWLELTGIVNSENVAVNNNYSCLNTAISKQVILNKVS